MKSGLWYCQCCDHSPTLQHKREAKLLVTTSDKPVSGSCMSESQWRRIETGHSGRGWKENNGERRRKFARSAALRPSVTTLGRSVARAAKPSSVGTLFDCRLCVWKAEMCMITHTGRLFNQPSPFSILCRKMNSIFLWGRTSRTSSSGWLLLVFPFGTENGEGQLNRWKGGTRVEKMKKGMACWKDFSFLQLYCYWQS